MLKNLDINKIQRGSLLFSVFCFILLIIIIIDTPYATNFETSIYSAYPFYFWIIFLSVIISTSLFFVLYSINNIGTKYMIFNIILFLSIMILFFSMPIFRGYALYGRGGQGLLWQIGRARTILETNHIGAETWYPVPHIFLSYLKMLGFSFQEGIIILQSSIYFLYIVFSFLYVKKLCVNFDEIDRGYTIALIGLVPFVYMTFHMYFTPAIMSLWLIPLFLFLIQKDTNKIKSFYLLMILVGFTIVFFHALTSLILMMIIGIMALVDKIYPYFMNIDFEKKTQYYNPLLLLSIAFFSWALRFSTVVESLLRSLEFIFIGADIESPAERGVEAAATSGLRFHEIVIRFIESYGVIWVYAILAGLIGIWSFKEFVLSKKEINYSTFLFSVLLIAGIIYGLASLLTRAVAHEIVRLSKIVIMISTFIIVAYLNRSMDEIKKSHQSKKRKPKMVLTSIVVFIVLLSLIISFFGVYSPNDHLTYSEREGTEWFIDYSNTDKETIQEGMHFRTFWYLKGTYNQSIERGELFDGEQHPKHLGYNENETIRESIGNETYMITKEYDYNWYKELETHQLEYTNYYTEDDLERLNEDPTASKIYCNGGFTTWKMNSN